MQPGFAGQKLSLPSFLRINIAIINVSMFLAPDRSIHAAASFTHVLEVHLEVWFQYELGGGLGQLKCRQVRMLSRCGFKRASIAASDLWLKLRRNSVFSLTKRE